MAAHRVLRDRVSQCEGQAMSSGGTRDETQVLERLKHWLRQQGMNIDLVEVKPSQVGAHWLHVHIGCSRNTLAAAAAAAAAAFMC